MILLPLIVSVGLAAEGSHSADPLDRLVLTDGQVLVGHVKADGEVWSLTLGDGTVLRFPDEAVDQVDWDAGHRPPSTHRQGWNALPEDWDQGLDRWPTDPAGDRYLLWPTGRSLGKGEGSLSQREIAGSIVSYNVSDNVEVSAGAIVPLLFSEYSRMAALGMRLSAPVGQKGFVAVGVEGLVLFDQAFVAPHAALGVELGALTLTAGGGGAVGTDQTSFSVGMVGASWHVSPRVWLLSENWIVAGGFVGTSARVVPTLSARLITRRVSFDAGLVAYDPYGDGSTILPIPVFNVAWHFPNARF